MVIENEEGQQVVRLKLTCVSSRNRDGGDGSLRLTEFMEILSTAETDADIRREFWRRAEIRRKVTTKIR